MHELTYANAVLYKPSGMEVNVDWQPQAATSEDPRVLMFEYMSGPGHILPGGSVSYGNTTSRRQDAWRVVHEKTGLSEDDMVGQLRQVWVDRRSDCIAVLGMDAIILVPAMITRSYFAAEVKAGSDIDPTMFRDPEAGLKTHRWMRLTHAVGCASVKAQQDALVYIRERSLLTRR
ncbi:MAG TPA: hypothetical protein VJ836_03670 [Candidatus Saccharimonadales bacterium]|nr:hypothetical protein [Candidatus Saccharimonadales bacterium]